MIIIIGLYLQIKVYIKENKKCKIYIGKIKTSLILLIEKI